MEAFLADPDIHGIIIVSHAAFLLGAPDIFQRANKFEKPVVSWLYGSGMEELIGKIDENKETVVFPNLDRAVRALSRLKQYHKYLDGEHG